jgi:hypothetical protein
VDPAYGVSPAEFIEALLDAECHELHLTGWIWKRRA